MGEALVTRKSNHTTASTKSHLHLPNVAGSTTPANEQRVFCSVYSFKNMRAQRRCSNLSSLGKRSIVTNINHGVRKSLTTQPKKCQNSRFSVAMHLSLSGCNSISDLLTTKHCLWLVLCIIFICCCCCVFCQHGCCYHHLPS